MSMVCCWRSAPLLPHEPCHDRRTAVPILNVLFPPPDLIALGGGLLLAHFEDQAEGMPVDLPGALLALRDYDGLQRPIGTEMVRPVRLVRDDVADDLPPDLAGREALELFGRLGVHHRQHEGQYKHSDPSQWVCTCRGGEPVVCHVLSSAWRYAVWYRVR